MKKIGLIGGISPKSTVDYYNQINEAVNKKLGRYNSAEIIMVSVNFEEIVSSIFSNRWDTVFSIMKEAAFTLQTAGVEVLALCSNTLHKVYPRLKYCVNMPLIHILDPVIEIVKREKLVKVGLLGTKFTMEESFYIDYINNHCDVSVTVPNSSDRNIIDDIIFNNLCKGECTKSCIDDANRILENLMNAGSDAVILGCTELPHLFEKLDFSARIINTTALHSEMLADFSCWLWDKSSLKQEPNLIRV